MSIFINTCLALLFLTSKVLSLSCSLGILAKIFNYNFINLNLPVNLTFNMQVGNATQSPLLHWTSNICSHLSHSGKDRSAATLPVASAATLSQAFLLVSLQLSHSKAYTRQSASPSCQWYLICKRWSLDAKHPCQKSQLNQNGGQRYSCGVSRPNASFLQLALTISVASGMW